MLFVRPGVVTSMAEKPEKLFLITEHVPGCPVFDSNGRLLGIAVQQVNLGIRATVVRSASVVAGIAEQIVIDQ